MKPSTSPLRILAVPALLALGAAPLAADALQVEPRDALLAPGATVRFQVRPVPAGAGPERKSDAAVETKAEACWRWEVPGHPGLIDAETGVFTAPAQAGELRKSFQVVATAPDGRRLTTTVSVLPAAPEGKQEAKGAAEPKGREGFPRTWSSLGFRDPFDPALLAGIPGPQLRLTTAAGLFGSYALPFPDADRQLLSYRLGRWPRRRPGPPAG